MRLLRSSFLTVEGYASDESIQIGSVKQAPYAVALAPKFKRNPLEFHGRIKLIPLGGEAGPVANGVGVQMDLHAPDKHGVWITKPAFRDFVQHPGCFTEHSKA